MLNLESFPKQSQESFSVFSYEFGTLFQGLIILNQCKTILEVGVAEATTTQFLCQAAKLTGGKVYGYDKWNVHGLRNQYWKISSKSKCEKFLQDQGYDNFELTQTDTSKPEFLELLKNKHSSIDFAFIDGCHSYKGVKNDFDAVYPLLSNCGMIAFHDTLRIDGTREFMIDLRTIYNDGTFDLVEFPFGNGDRRVGISLLVKRSIIPLTEEIGIDEIANLEDRTHIIYEKEKKWYESQTKNPKSKQFLNFNI